MACLLALRAKKVDYDPISTTYSLVIRKILSAYNNVGRAINVCYTQLAICVYRQPMAPPALVTQTTYAELLERCAAAAFGSAFPADGQFTPKTIRGRRYWYFQNPTHKGRAQQYVGPETPELLERIALHKEARADERERRALVSALVRSFGLPRPIAQIGNILAALAEAGIFRLRGVLVGTIAYQTYPAMLGLKLPAATLQTGDIDIAQFTNVSVAVAEHTAPILDILKQVDKTFRAIPHLTDRHRTTRYIDREKIRVEFVTPNEGPDTDEPQPLPAFQTDAQPLRFLDFLIHEPEPAVVLHDVGIYVQVPRVERFAVHKLILSRIRRETIKIEKDLRQAEALLEALAQKKPYELKAAWDEAYDRGPGWQQRLKEGLSQISVGPRDRTLKTIGRCRGEIPNVDLVFKDSPPRYDADRMVVLFAGEDGDRLIQCGISYEALADHFGSTDGRNEDRQLEIFRKHRGLIEGLARTKYLSWQVEDPASLLVKTNDIPRLRAQTKAMRPSS